MTRKRKINWYRVNRDLHRDLGYLVIGLTIVFAVSGIALNHIKDWNPNYIVNRYEKPLTATEDEPEEQLQKELLGLFSVTEPVKTSYWESPQHYKLFFNGGGSLSARFDTKNAVYEQIRARPVFKQFNHLHLNEAKKGWIVFSDIYAGILLYLALSSLFMVKGKYSPWRRKRGWLVVVGGIIPLVYIFM